MLISFNKLEFSLYFSCKYILLKSREPEVKKIQRTGLKTGPEIFHPRKMKTGIKGSFWNHFGGWWCIWDWRDTYIYFGREPLFFLSFDGGLSLPFIFPSDVQMMVPFVLIKTTTQQGAISTTCSTGLNVTWCSSKMPFANWQKCCMIDSLISGELKA